MKKHAIIVAALMALIGCIYFGYQASVKEAAKQNEQVAAARKIINEVSESTCIVDAAITEFWMKEMACSKRVDMLVKFSDIIGEYPTTYQYRMNDARQAEVPAVKLYYRVRQQ